MSSGGSFNCRSSAQHSENGIVSHPWSDLSIYLNELEYFFSANPQENFNHRMKGDFGSLRKAFHEIFLTIHNENNVPDSNLIERLKKDVKRGLETSNRSYDNSDQLTFKGKMNFLIPKGGLVDNKVQRLLLKSGSERHLSYAPMVIYVQPINDITQ